MQILPFFRLIRVLVSFLLIAVLMRVAVVEPAYGRDREDKEKDIEQLASQLAKSLAANKVKKILVLDFNTTDPSLTEATKFVTSRIVGALGDQKKRFKVSEQGHLSPTQAALASMPLSNEAVEAFRYVADAIVLGTLQNSASKDIVTVAIEDVDVATGKRLAAFEVPLSRSVLPDTPKPLRGNQPLVVGRDHVISPSCLHCSNPQYSREAREAGREGTVVLRVIVSEEGRAQQIGVIKMLGYGLDEKAIATVRNWSFKPATRAGRPVAVIVPIEVTFRLF